MVCKTRTSCKTPSFVLDWEIGAATLHTGCTPDPRDGQARPDDQALRTREGVG